MGDFIWPSAGISPSLISNFAPAGAAAAEAEPDLAVSEDDPLEDPQDQAVPVSDLKSVNLHRLGDVDEFARRYNTRFAKQRRRNLGTIYLTIATRAGAPHDSTLPTTRTLMTRVEEMIGRLFLALSVWRLSTDRPKDKNDQPIPLTLVLHLRGRGHDPLDVGGRGRAISCNFDSVPALEVVGCLVAEPAPDSQGGEAYLSPQSVASLLTRLKGVRSVRMDLNLDRYQNYTMLDAIAAMRVLKSRVFALGETNRQTLHAVELFSSDAVILENKYLPVSAECRDDTKLLLLTLAGEIALMGLAAPALNVLVLKDVCDVHAFFKMAEKVYSTSDWQSLKSLIVSGESDEYLDPIAQPFDVKGQFETLTKSISRMPRLKQLSVESRSFPNRPSSGKIAADQRKHWLGRYETLSVKLILSGRPGNPAETKGKRREARRHFNEDDTVDFDEEVSQGVIMKARGVFDTRRQETPGEREIKSLADPWAELVQDREVNKVKVLWRQDLRPGQPHRGCWYFGPSDSDACSGIERHTIS